MFDQIGKAPTPNTKTSVFCFQKINYQIWTAITKCFEDEVEVSGKSAPKRENYFHLKHAYKLNFGIGEVFSPYSPVLNSPFTQNTKRPRNIVAKIVTMFNKIGRFVEFDLE